MKVRLKDVAEFTSGFAFKSSRFNTDGEGMPLIRIRDVTRGYTETYYSGEYDSRYIVNKGDYLIGMDGEFNLAKWTGNPSLLNQRVCKIGKTDKKLDRSYLARFLPPVLKKIEAVTPFVTVKHLSISDLMDVSIEIPSLERQKEVVSILDQAEQILEKRRQTLAKIDQLAQSIFLDMFGDPATNPKKWSKVKIGEIAEVKIGPFGTLLHKHDYVSGGVPLVNPTHIDDLNIIPNLELTVGSEKYAKLSAYHMRTNDIVLGRRGEMGRCALVTNREDGYLCGTGSMFIRPSNKINPIFLVHLISSKQIKKELENKAQGVTMMNLNAGTISGLEIIYPKIEIQDKFELFLEKLKNTKERHKESLNKLELLQQSLSQKFFDQ